MIMTDHSGNEVVSKFYGKVDVISCLGISSSYLKKIRSSTVMRIFHTILDCKQALSV